jgi:prepilin-type processing-associated H-X9-DG protein
MLFPFCEQISMYEAAASWLAVAANSRTSAGANPFNTRMQHLECPSETADRLRKVYSDVPQLGGSNYVFSGADWQDALHAFITLGRPSVRYDYAVNPRAAFNGTIAHTTTDTNPSDPPENYQRYKSLASIGDGTSNTIALSESCQGNGNKLLARVGIVQVATNIVNRVGIDYYYPDATNAATYTYASRCLATAPGGKYPSTGTGAPISRSDMKGIAWYIPTNIFHTVMPPNGPSCHADPGDGSVYGDVAEIIKSAGSYHPGGVNAALFDGSGRFVSETIYCGASTAKLKNIGASEFGVWGAMGSINGGESAAMP